jgi:hypothetical protein
MAPVPILKYFAKIERDLLMKRHVITKSVVRKWGKSPSAQPQTLMEHCYVKIGLRKKPSYCGSSGIERRQRTNGDPGLTKP